jgi:hypothetical protein
VCSSDPLYLLEMENIEDETVNVLHTAAAVAEESAPDFDQKEVVVDDSAATTNNANNDEKFVLQLKDLSFTPSKQLVRHAVEYGRNMLTEYKLNWLFPALKRIGTTELQDAPLHRINCSVVSGELTAIIGSNRERQELINLMVGRMNTGEFDGDILLSGPGITNNSYFYDKMAFVQRVSNVCV